MFCSDSQGHRSYQQRGKLTLRKPIYMQGGGAGEQMKEKGSIEILGVGTCGAGNDMNMFPTNVKQASSLSFIVHVELCLRTRVSFFVWFQGCFVAFLQLSSKNLFPRKTKPEILSEVKQKKQVKNSPDTNHTKHSSHLISCYMHRGNQEHQVSGHQCSEILAQVPSL